MSTRWPRTQDQLAPPDEPYNADAAAANAANKFQNFRAPFGHLLNFFQTSLQPDGTPTNAAHFYRLFEYTHVPSRFTGTERMLNPDPNLFGSASSGPNRELEGFHPPFNRVSNFRDPGRVNINTVIDQRVWEGINLIDGPISGPN